MEQGSRERGPRERERRETGWWDGSSAPARDVRVSHESAPTAGHDPCPKPKPNPGAYSVAGRRGRKEDARLPTVRTVEHHGSRARPSVAPKPQTNRHCEFMHLLPIPIAHSVAGLRR